MYSFSPFLEVKISGDSCIFTCAILNVQFDSRISNASAFVQKLQKDTDENFIRCPYLANIEIERRKHLHGKDNDEKLMELLMQYFVRY